MPQTFPETNLGVAAEGVWRQQMQIQVQLCDLCMVP